MKRYPAVMNPDPISNTRLQGLAVLLILLAALLVFPGPSRADAGSLYDHLEGSRRIAEYSGRVHFYFLRDTDDSFEGVEFLGQEGLKGKNFEEVEVSGSIRFRGSGSKYRCQGNLSYSVKTYMESSLGEFKQVQVNDGRGSAPVHRGLLEIDWEAGSYSFYVMPGDDEEGVRVQSSWKSNIAETLHENVEGAGRIYEFSEAVNPGAWDHVMSWFPSDEWEESGYGITVQAVGVPLPAFSRTLAGSLTNRDGSVVTWNFVPALPDDPSPAKDSVNWTHHHPKNGDDYIGQLSFWDEITDDREVGQERKGTRDPYAGLPVSYERPRVFLVKPGDGGRSGTVVAGGDSLVPVDIPDEGLLFLSPEQEEVEREDRETAATVAEQKVSSVLISLFTDPALDQEYQGLENTLSMYPVFLDKVDCSGDTATVSLRGDLSGADTVHRQRIVGQITETARKAGAVNKVTISLNGAQL
jgi:hypothetical protein